MNLLVVTYCLRHIVQGINGILADEMGLGKTVQSIAFLCHIAETYCKYLTHWLLIYMPSSRKDFTYIFFFVRSCSCVGSISDHFAVVDVTQLAARSGPLCS